MPPIPEPTMHAAAARPVLIPTVLGTARTAGYRALLAAEVPALPARTVQLLLAALGLLPPGTASGRFDRDTARAVRAFQEAAGLEPNGVPGRATADALLARAD